MDSVSFEKSKSQFSRNICVFQKMLSPENSQETVATVAVEPSGELGSHTNPICIDLGSSSEVVDLTLDDDDDVMEVGVVEVLPPLIAEPNLVVANSVVDPPYRQAALVATMRLIVMQQQDAYAQVDEFSDMEPPEPDEAFRGGSKYLESFLGKK